MEANTKSLTFKLIGEGPAYEAVCKGEGKKDWLTLQGTGRERLYDPAGSAEGVAIIRFSEIRLSHILGFVVQKLQKETPSKDLDIELTAEVANKILNYHKRNPDKRYRIVLASEDGLF